MRVFLKINLIFIDFLLGLKDALHFRRKLLFVINFTFSDLPTASVVSFQLIQSLYLIFSGFFLLLSPLWRSDDNKISTQSWNSYQFFTTNSDCFLKAKMVIMFALRCYWFNIENRIAFLLSVPREITCVHKKNLESALELKNNYIKDL